MLNMMPTTYKVALKLLTQTITETKKNINTYTAIMLSTIHHTPVNIIKNVLSMLSEFRHLARMFGNKYVFC